MKPALRKYYENTYGVDDFEEGTVILFYKKFASGPMVYKYLALKMESTWALTKNKDSLSWYQLLEIFEQDNLLDPSAMFTVDSDAWVSLYELEEDDE